MAMTVDVKEVDVEEAREAITPSASSSRPYCTHVLVLTLGAAVGCAFFVTHLGDRVLKHEQVTAPLEHAVASTPHLTAAAASRQDTASTVSAKALSGHRHYGLKDWTRFLTRHPNSTKDSLRDLGWHKGDLPEPSRGAPRSKQPATAPKTKTPEEPNEVRTSAGEAATFAKMVHEVKKLRDEIRDYYKQDDKLLDASFDPDLPSEKMLQARIALKVIEARQSTEGVAFVIGSVGSSVTAGHDSFGTAAYPAVIQRVLGDIMKVVGIKLEVRNAAVGGQGPWWQSFCLQNRIGSGVDIITREYEYWTIDDGLQGRPVTMPGADKAEAAFELFVRIAMKVPGNSNPNPNCAIT